ncbi:MAG TPA: Flp pilus assembly protein CpaB [Acetobacteraceae bacterium]|nr:Flp pilus assembly protein CpaB [Acetobacteraceae bacterium]
MLRTMLFLFMGAGVLVFSFVAWQTLHPPAAPAPVIPKETVLAAASTLRAGTLLKPEDIEAREMPEADVPAGARKDSPQARSELFGAMVRQTLLQHQVVLPADVMRPGDHGFLAAVLTPGKRATSVGVDAVSGTAGLIWPGDHVDLILTEDVPDPNAPGGHQIAAETVLKDVRVIAIDQQLVQGGNQNGANDAGSRTVTLEVTPEDAERVNVAAKLGKLSLAVRPVDAAPSADTGNSHPVTWGSSVAQALAPQKSPEAPNTTVRVYNGGTEEDHHF